MKVYRVDLTSLDPVDRVRAYDLIDGYAFITSMVLGSNGLEGAVVYWESQEDFPSSPVYPNGCPYQLISQ